MKIGMKWNWTKKTVRKVLPFEKHLCLEQKTVRRFSKSFHRDQEIPKLVETNYFWPFLKTLFTFARSVSKIVCWEPTRKRKHFNFLQILKNLIFADNLKHQFRSRFGWILKLIIFASYSAFCFRNASSVETGRFLNLLPASSRAVTVLSKKLSNYRAWRLEDRR